MTFGEGYALIIRPLRIQYPGVAYDVMSRGVARGDIFGGDADHRRFVLLLQAVQDGFGLARSSLVKQRGRGRTLARDAALHLLHAHTSLKNAEVRKLFDLSTTAVARSSERVRLRSRRDKELARKLEHAHSRFEV